MDISLNDFSSPTQVLLEGLDQKSWWKQRSGFEQKLLICLVGAAIIIFGCFLYIIFSSSGRSEVCHTVECLQAASQILGHLDQTLNPCENFFQFTCGKILKEKDRKWKTRPTNLLSEEIKNQVLRMITEPVKDQDHYELKIQKKLFAGCMNGSEQNSVETFKQFLVKLNGWPMVVGNNWKGDQFDWIKTIIMLKRDGYDDDMLLKIVIESDPLNYQRYLLSIKPPSIKSYTDREIPRKSAIKTAVLFGADENFAAREIDDIYKFQEELFQIRKKCYDEGVNETKITIADYQNQDVKMNWLEFLNAYLHPIGKLTKEDSVILICFKYIQQMKILVEKTPTRVVSNYIILHVLEDIIPFISNNIWRKYTCALGSDQERVDFCYRFACHTSSIVHYEYAKRRLPQKNKLQVQEMFEKIKLKFVDLISQLHWATSELKGPLQNKLNNLTVKIGNLEEDSDKINVMNSGNQGGLDLDFFNLHLYNNVRIKNSYLMQLFANRSRLDFSYYLMTTGTQTFSFMANDFIVIPVGLLQNIYYDPKRPMYLNYGALGKIIGTGVVFAAITVDQQDRLSDRVWSDKNIEAFENHTRCILHTKTKKIFHENYLFYSNQLKVSQFIGVDIAYDAYREWARENKEQQLIGLDYTPNQLFWISASMDQCFESVSEDDTAHEYNFLKDNKIVSNNPDFAKDFNCPLNTPMNPSEKCYV